MRGLLLLIPRRCYHVTGDTAEWEESGEKWAYPAGVVTLARDSNEHRLSIKMILGGHPPLQYSSSHTGYVCVCVCVTCLLPLRNSL